MRFEANKWSTATAASLSRLIALLLIAVASTALAAPEKKTVRMAFRAAETGFDPQRIEDCLLSRAIVSGVNPRPRKGSGMAPEPNVLYRTGLYATTI